MLLASSAFVAVVSETDFAGSADISQGRTNSIGKIL